MSVNVANEMASQEAVVRNLLHRLVAHPHSDEEHHSNNPMSMDELREAVQSARAWGELVDEVKVVKSLHLPNSSIGDEALGRLSAAFEKKKGSNLLSLDLSNNGITEQGFKTLADAIEEGALRHLEHLNLSRNPIGLVGEDGMKSLARIIEGGCLPSLQYLDMSHCCISDVGAAILSESVQSGNFKDWALKSLNLSSNEFGGEGMTALSRMLIMGRLPNLRRLDLSFNKLGKQGTAALLKTMKADNFTGLTHLYLSGCALSDNLVRFSNEIEQGKLPNLQHLDLSSNYLGDLGAIAFAAALSSGKMAKLRSLILAQCTMSANRIELITKAIEKGRIHDLRRLDLSGIALDVTDSGSSARGSLALATIIRRGNLRELEYLDLSHCSLADDGVVTLAGEMEAGNLPQLRHLLMKDTDVQSERSLKACVKALESGKVPHLQELELGFNRTGDDVNMALATLLELSAAEGPVVQKLKEYLRSNRSAVDSPETMTRLARVWRSFKSLRSHGLKGMRQLSLAHSSSKDLHALQRFNSIDSFEGFAIQGLSPERTPKFTVENSPRAVDNFDARQQPAPAPSYTAKEHASPRFSQPAVVANNSHSTLPTRGEGNGAPRSRPSAGEIHHAESPTRRGSGDTKDINPGSGYTRPIATNPNDFGGFQTFEPIANTARGAVGSVDNLQGPDVSSTPSAHPAATALSFQGFGPAFEAPAAVPWFTAHAFSKAAGSSKGVNSKPKSFAPFQPVGKPTRAAGVLDRQPSVVLGLGLDEPDLARNDKFFFNVILICVWIFAVFISRS